MSIEPLPFGASPAALVQGKSNKMGVAKTNFQTRPFSGSEEEEESPLVASLSEVPDSCCIKERDGCGKKAFENDGTTGQLR